MNYSFIIRKATIDDAEAIQTITRIAFRKYIENTGLGTMEALEETIEDIIEDIQTKEVFVAFIDDVPVGTIRLKINPDNTGYISRFGVNTEYHNIGIGKALINLIDKLVKKKGIKRVTLHTASKYKDLIRFYYGRGFYIESTSSDRGYIRALLVKEYE